MKISKELLLKYARDNKLDFNIVLKYYIFETFIHRLSLSAYRDKVILKGGLFLSLYTDLSQRVTKDVDFSIVEYDLNTNNVYKIVKEIINIDIDDYVSFSIDSVERINELNEYYGLRIYLEYTAFGIRSNIHMDLATGDIITPHPSITRYHSFFSDKYYDICTYNIETYIAEKLETIFSKLENNSRMKDYYDIYILEKYFNNRINNRILKQAIYNTFASRNVGYDIFKTIDTIKNSEVLKKYWELYRKKNEYAKNINFKETVKAIENLAKFCINGYKQGMLRLSFV